MSDELKQRLAAKTTKAENGCWLWIGASRGNGYGAIKIDGKVVDSHRAAYIAHKGPIPDGKIVMHKCDHRACVNPDHLQLGTHADNNADAIAKGLAKPWRPNRAEPLTDAQLKRIKNDFERGVSVAALSRKYNVPRTSMSRLLGLCK